MLGENGNASRNSIGREVSGRDPKVDRGLISSIPFTLDLLDFSIVLS